MSSTVKLQALVDLDGRVVAAHIEERDTPSKDQDVPSARLMPLEGQREVSVEVPAEVLDLPGPDLCRLLSQVRIRWPAEVELPEIEIVRDHRRDSSS